jgi:hypothetical protein
VRIAFTGSHGVGKSTLLWELHSLLPLPFVFDGVARKHKTYLDKLSPTGKQTYLDLWYVWKHYLTYNYESSRSIYDTWAYAQLTVHQDFHRNLFHWAKNHIWYDYLFYVPIEFDLISDGVRPDGRKYQLQHDKRLKLILDYHGVPYHTLTGTLEQRVQQMKDVLGYD